MTTDPVPSPRGRHVIEEIDHESLIYRRPTKAAIYLNETATVIWKLCDGTRTVQEIIAILADTFPDAAEDVRADVRQTIDELVGAGALELGDSKPAGPGSVVRLES
jgi:pyrroloquinoline quinone biosynthesis protein D